MSTQVSPSHGVDYTALTNFMQSAFDTSKALLESTEAQKAAILVSFGNSIRQIDDLLIQVAGVPDPAVRADLRSRLQAVRASVVAIISTHLPDEAFLWTPEMQASLRASDAYFTSGESRVFQSEEEFDAFLQEQSADV